MKINIKLVVIATIVSTIIIGLTSGMWLKGLLYSLMLSVFVSYLNFSNNQK